MTSGFTVSRLDESLARLVRDARVAHYCVAFSGGVDSTALLHAMAMLRAQYPGVEVRALHVNHHLQPQADDWARHCAECAVSLAVTCAILDVRVVPARGDSMEAAARAARYSALSQALANGEYLLTAHHRDDQLETVLLQLLRGAGIAGLSAMPECTGIGSGRLLRPLLDIGRADLMAYATAAGLCWIEDLSNEDTRFDRNFLRRRVLPALNERWPSAAAGASRSARHLAEAKALLEERAQEDLALAGAGANLRVSAIRALDPARARNLLRYWIARAGFRAPSSAILDQALRQMLHARADAMPLIEWGEAELRRFRDALYVGRAPPQAPSTDLSWDWRSNARFDLPEGLGRLQHRPAFPGESALAHPRQSLRVSWQSGAHRLLLAERTPRRTLRNLLQEGGVVPWMRPCLPRLFVGNSLVAVADLWIDAGSLARDEAGIVIEWLDHPPIF